jgi:beta-RFAP synthase
MIRVSAPSRLHFGLFTLPAEDGALWPDRDGRPALHARVFGGAGLMVEQPGLTVAVEPAREWSSSGPLAERALGFARHAAAVLQLTGPLRVVVEQAPMEHVGLGTGTQLGLAVARAVAMIAGRPELDALSLAGLADRGTRSALGVHGFSAGGFLVEAGKRTSEAVAPLAARMPFPTDWEIVLVMPRGLRGDHGEREATAFRQLTCQLADLRRTDALCRLVLLGMLPAIAERDLDAFGEALFDFNRRVGELFAPWQGGLYAAPRVAQLVEACRATGVRGVGQSSWGPTVYAIVSAEAAPTLCERLVVKHGCLSDEIKVTRAANTGSFAWVSVT